MDSVPSMDNARCRPPRFEDVLRALRGLPSGSLGPDLCLKTDAVLALNRAPNGSPLAWETFSARPDGSVGARYGTGLTKGVVLVGTPRRAVRLVITEGALAAAATLIVERAENTRYLGLSGQWTDSSSLAVENVVRYLGATVVVVANSTHHEAGQRDRVRALEDLASLDVYVGELLAPRHGWLAELVRARHLPGTVP